MQVTDDASSSCSTPAPPISSVSTPLHDAPVSVCSTPSIAATDTASAGAGAGADRGRGAGSGSGSGTTLPPALSWVLLPRHSDAFLLRIRRKILSFRPRERSMPMPQSPSIGFSETTIPRSNIDGSSEISFCFLL